MLLYEHYSRVKDYSCLMVDFIGLTDSYGVNNYYFVVAPAR